MKGTWETTEGGGGGLGTVVLVILAAAILGPAVAAAVAELLHLLVIVLVVLAAVAGAGAVALVAFRVSRGRQETARVPYQITPAPPRPSPLRSEPRPAIEAPRQVHPALPRHRPRRGRRHHPQPSGGPMIIAIAAIAILVYLAFHLGAGHTHHRYRKAHGLRPNFYWSSVRGPYASIRLPGGFRVGHRL